MKTLIGADAAKLAGLQIDQLQKIRSGQLSLDHLDRFLNLSSIAREERFGGVYDPWAEARLKQERFYKETLGMNVSLEDICIPDTEDDFTLPLIIHERMVEQFSGHPIEALFQIAKSRFPSWKYADEALDDAITKHERHPENGSYAILVRDVQEADEENANLSATDVSEKEMLTETILERIFHEIFYFWKTGKHLDQQNLTLCSGSRHRDGFVPYAYWRDEFNVDWSGVSFRDSSLRSRSVRA